MDDEEKWEWHPHLPYELSTHGRAKDRHGKLVGHVQVGGRSRGYKVHKQYMRIGSHHYIHTLMLETFVGDKPADHEADHIDFDGLNNHISNLRWLPISENRKRKNV